jgi:Domain of unknown function (DUF4260)
LDTTLTARREADMPRLLLRLEGLALFVLATAAFAHMGHSLWLYAVLFFVPDLRFAAYTVGPKPGAVIYNVLHSTLGAAVLAGLGWQSGNSLLLGLAAIWAAHIGFDRMLGYGLKYASGFKDTHLGRIGPKSAGA